MLWKLYKLPAFSLSPYSPPQSVFHIAARILAKVKIQLYISTALKSFKSFSSLSGKSPNPRGMCDTA